MMKYQDIHSTDSTLWKQYQSLMESGSYDEAAVVLKKAQLDNKRIDAALFNDITTELTRLQNQGKDSTWSKNVMAVATEPPAGMGAGECYCKVTHRIKPMYKLVIHGLDASPTVAVSDADGSVYQTDVMSASISGVKKPADKDGTYYFSSKATFTPYPVLVYLKYGMANTGTVLVYKNSEKIEELRATLSDWSLNETNNTYSVAVNGYTIAGMQYNPFIMYDTTWWSHDMYSFYSDTNIDISYEQTDEVINITVNITTS